MKTRGVMFAILLWMVIATGVFRMRHPWATETEVFLNLGSALTFQRVPRPELPPSTGEPTLALPSILVNGQQSQ